VSAAGAIASFLAVGVTVLAPDAIAARRDAEIFLLRGMPGVDRAGTLGHSFGGNTVLFHAAIDARVRFACARGAACTYRRKIAAGTRIEIRS
jgi:hypothetical protein